ncbi:hypothetical protein KSS87_020504, partial [Heliosperma pusillum]
MVMKPGDSWFTSGYNATLLMKQDDSLFTKELQMHNGYEQGRLIVSPRSYNVSMGNEAR